MTAFYLKETTEPKLFCNKLTSIVEREKKRCKSYRNKAFQRENVFEPIIGRLCKSPEISGD